MPNMPRPRCHECSKAMDPTTINGPRGGPIRLKVYICNDDKTVDFSKPWVKNL